MTLSVIFNVTALYIQVMFKIQYIDMFIPKETNECDSASLFIRLQVSREIVHRILKSVCFNINYIS